MKYMPLVFVGLIFSVLASCAVPLPQISIDPAVAKTLTSRELEAIHGNYAYVGESHSAVMLTPAFSAGQIVDTQTVQAGADTTEIDTYEHDTFALLSVVADCTVIYWSSVSNAVTLVNSYSTTFDNRYADHGC